MSTDLAFQRRLAFALHGVETAATEAKRAGAELADIAHAILGHDPDTATMIAGPPPPLREKVIGPLAALDSATTAALLAGATNEELAGAALALWPDAVAKVAAIGR